MMGLSTNTQDILPCLDKHLFKHYCCKKLLGGNLAVFSFNRTYMKPTKVFRTDFSQDDLWNRIVTLAQQAEPEFGFSANLSFIDNINNDERTPEDLCTYFGKDSEYSCFFVVDKLTLNHREFPLLCVDLWEKWGNQFRVIPGELWGVENNLSIANMDFQEFATAVDEDGIFRGFY